MIDIYRLYIQTRLAWFLAYRVNIVFGVFGRSFVLVLQLIIWTAVAQSNGGEVGTYNANDFAIYYLTWMVVRNVVAAVDATWLSVRIRSGELSQLLLRPLHPVHVCLAESTAYKSLSTPIYVATALLFIPVFGVSFAFNAAEILRFIAAMVVGAMLYFQVCWLITLVAFWTTETLAINNIRNTLEWFFGGRLAPLALMPPAMQTISLLLPFRWAFAFPVELLMNRLTHSDIVTGFAMQVLWITGCFPLMALIWRAGLQKYTAVGG